MDGPIELPPDANPLTPQLLFQHLVSAVSPQQQRIRAGTQQLQTWETERGYYSGLQDICIEKSLPYEVRYLAIIQLKNGIDKYWRKTAANAVAKEEKTLIRSRLLDYGINEAFVQLALQNAIVIAKIVRFEFPNDWPEVITSVVSLLRAATQPNANPIHLPRALLILLQIVKELSTARLQRSRVSLQSVTPEILYMLGRVYVERVQKWRAFLSQGGDDEGGAIEAIEHSLLALKILRRLLIAGYEFPNRDKDVCEFWTIVRDHFGDFLAVSEQGVALSEDVHRQIGKHLIQFSKLHVEMARVHPAAYALLPDTLSLTRAYWSLAAKLGETFGSKTAVVTGKIQSSGDAENEKPLTERLSLQGLILLRACIKMVWSPTKTFKYRQPEDKEEQKRATDMMNSELLTESLAHEVMEIVVTRFFVFRESDLREWEEEPEEWEAREEGEGDAWEFSIRGTSEKLFLDLIIHFKSSLVQPLLNVFYTVSTPASDNILFKDSIYTALGLAASVLHQNLDFDAFLISTLVVEVQKQPPGYNILRRRIAILLGQWTPVKVSAANRPVVYQIFQHLLSRDEPLNDQVVRVTAGRQFKHVADEWEFDATAFMPYAPDILSRLMALIEEVELTETKMALLNTVSVIVVRMEHHVNPFAERIVALLPPLWEQSEQEHLMKQAILTILTRLINAMKDESRRYHPMILPLIARAVEPSSDMQTYLLEDALDLWAAVLVQTPAPASPEILSLAPHLFPIFALGSESLRKGLEIMESYILLAPSELLHDEMRDRLIASFATLLSTVKAKDSGIITHLMEYVIRQAEILGGEAAVEVVVSGLVASGLLKTVLSGISDNWEARQTTGPNKRYPPLDVVVETDYFSVLARIALASPRLLVTSMAATNPLGEDRMDQTLDEWFSHFGNIGSPTQRKLACLAFTRLLETGEKWILQRMQDLMAVWTDVASELQEGTEDERGDSLVYQDPEGLRPTSGPEAPEDERRRQFLFADPVHRAHTLQFIRERLLQVIERCGGQDAFHRDWLVNVDREVVSSFGRLGLL
ncbi:MAG: hypothetical protein M1832_004986 [Thelocarpon impressellum]|nr:MAG: hypothetical protein M1832_004986 [Thelocarpon impressellum]